MALRIVGTGPGAAEEMTARARRAIENADVIVGYTLYNELLKKEFPDKEYIATPMRKEAERCRLALKRAAQGAETVLICSGDSGVYGMSSLTLEIADMLLTAASGAKETSHENIKENIEIEIIPGITAALSGGALLGAPLSNDFAVISLSDLLTPWEAIEKRLHAAAAGDLVIVIYNPGSKKRRDHLKRACDIVLKYRSSDTPCGVVRNISRENESTGLLTLGDLRGLEADMLMTVFIGNSATRNIRGRLVTPRGYAENGRLDDICAAAAADSGMPDKQPEVNRLKSIVIFGGTTEGRMLAEAAVKSGVNTLLSVATDYGEEVLDDVIFTDGFRLHTGHLDKDEIISLITDIKPDAVFDATHPYASGVTASVSAAAAAAGVRYIRVRRDISGGMPEDAPADVCSGIIYVPDAESAAAVLDTTAERAFITTGSRSADVFARVSRAAERLTLRVLPSEESLRLCREAGFKGKNIICMQGPFSAEMNEAMFRAAGAGVLVTKASGKTGGFPEKLEAARRLGMRVIVVAPPGDIPGISVDEARGMLDSAPRL